MTPASHHVLIESYDQLRSAFPGGENRLPSETIWRGQADSQWGLSSSFDRLYERYRTSQGDPAILSECDPEKRKRYVESYRERRDSYLHAFRRFAAGLRGTSPAKLSTDQWWALGRHFGLRTPLLDWSERPYVAVFFAVRGLLWSLGRTVGDIGAVQLVGRHCAIYRLQLCDPVYVLKEHGFRIVRPELEELSRMHNQQGLFSFLDSGIHLDLETFLREHNQIAFLTKFLVPDHVALEAYRDLHNFGVDWRLLYPDLTGAALASNDFLETPCDLWDLKYGMTETWRNGIG